MEGRKDDQDKPDYTLLPFDALENVVKVLGFGARKYERDNWRKVPDARNRYIAAALRHVIAYQRGEVLDSESKLPHLSHAVCCLLFADALDIALHSSEAPPAVPLRAVVSPAYGDVLTSPDNTSGYIIVDREDYTVHPLHRQEDLPSDAVAVYVFKTSYLKDDRTLLSVRVGADSWKFLGIYCSYASAMHEIGELLNNDEPHHNRLAPLKKFIKDREGFEVEVQL